MKKKEKVISVSIIIKMKLGIKNEANANFLTRNETVGNYMKWNHPLYRTFKI